MIIAERLRAIRAEKKLSQADLEKRTGLFRCYISRCENGHTVPSIETLEKLARAMEVPMYQLFYDGENPPVERMVFEENPGFGTSGAEASLLRKFRRLLCRTTVTDQKLLLYLASKMAARNR